MNDSGFSLTLQTATVLAAIAAGHRYGFDLMDATGLPAGTVYPILRRLERHGALEGSWEGEAAAREAGRPARRNYHLTEEGAAALRRARARYPVLFFELGPEGGGHA